MIWEGGGGGCVDKDKIKTLEALSTWPGMQSALRFRCVHPEKCSAGFTNTGG